MKYIYLLIAVIISIIDFTCMQYNVNGQPGNREEPSNNTEFNAYWYQGKAEITTYKLQQARYGEIHEGDAVLIFVTEDFSRSKQVKLDNPARAGNDAVPVLKLNFTKKFNTGIYPYSMMLSVFTPVRIEDHPHTLKATASSQEWCGHTFTQFNLRNDHYQIFLYSYFESEGDQNKSVPIITLEDELWTRIRINPTSLPTGEVRLIPGLLTQRLRHTVIKPETANISIKDEVLKVTQEELKEEAECMVYTIQYKDNDRTLAIYFQKDFPYQILKWEETYQDGFGKDAKKLTTKAVKNKSIMIDYWNKNKNEDAYLRELLGLTD